MPNAISTTIMSSIAQGSDAHEAALRSGDLVFSKMGGGMKAFPPASSFLWPQTRWPTHTSPERDLYYNVIGCARQERRSRGRAHTHHRAESCPNSEAPSSFATAGSRRVMTEQGTPDARKKYPFETEAEVVSATVSFKGNDDYIPPAHLCCAPKPPPLLFSNPARQS